MKKLTSVPNLNMYIISKIDKSPPKSVFSFPNRDPLLAEDVSFYIKYNLLSWNKNENIQRPISLSGSSLTHQKAHII